MTYEEAARILTRYSKTVNVPSLQVAIEMGADALFKRAAQEKSVSYVKMTMPGTMNDILNNCVNGDIVKYTNNEDNAPMAE